MKSVISNGCLLYSILEYTTDVLEEAKLFSIHAGRKQVELEDIKLACQNWAEGHSTMPSKDVE